MSARDPHDGPGLTLLIQLFGRDVLDRLERAGYRDEAAICAAAPDRLASTTGVSLGQAQRIIAVVEETRLAAAFEPEEPETAAAKPAREPRRNKKKTPAPADVKPAEPRVEAVRAKMEADEADPFVDDVALVSWMGFSAKTPSGRLNFSVADRILDPVRPEPAPPETPASAPEAAAATTALAADPRPPAPVQERPPKRTLPGSFWSFGRPARPRAATDATGPEPAGTRDTPDLKAPRKVRDDH